MFLLLLLLLLVPLAAIVLVALAVIGFAGIGPLTDGRRADRSGVAGAVGPAVGLLLGSVVLVGGLVAVVVMVGVGGRSHADRGAGTGPPTTVRPAAPPAVAPDTDTTATSRPAAGGPRAAAGLGPVVAIEADGGQSFPVSYDVADGLAPATVLQMRVTGFDSFQRGYAEQCTNGPPPRCGNAVPVQFDADGAAEFQYLVTDDFLLPRAVPGRCRATTTPCTVVVRASSGRDRGEIQTVFVDRVAPAGRVSVSPSSGLSLDGETVTVRVEGYPPGARLAAMLCAAPDAIGTRCGAPGPTTPLVVGFDGTGRARLALEPSRVGTEGAPCFRGDDCGVSVASESVFARAPVVPVSFAAPPGASYDPTRLVFGLGLAFVLLVIAAVLLRRTDWAPIGEVAAPEIEDAEYADLDAIIAALPPIEDEPAPMH